MLTPTKPVKSCECGSPCGDCCGCTKESIGLGNVDNTSDLNKPLSTAMINALSSKVDLDTFTQLKNRVLALENSMPDITDLEHRMDEAEDDILGLNAGYNSLHNTVLSMADSITDLGGRVTAFDNRITTLELADANNVKISGQQTITGFKIFQSNIGRMLTGVGQNVLNIYNSTGNTYIYSIKDNSDKLRGSINHQCIITGDRATRMIQMVQSDDYNTTERTGALASLTEELIPDGRYDVRLSRSKGDGSTAGISIAKILGNGTIQSALLDSYATMVRTAGNQEISGTKLFYNKILGIATGGDAQSSEAISIGNYKAVYRISRNTLSTFRGVALITSWQRAVGFSLEFITVTFHGDNATGINVFRLTNKTCDYFVSYDDNYVYIGLKSVEPTLSAGSKQLSVIATAGFNQVCIFQGYDGQQSATVEGTLIAETS